MSELVSVHTAGIETPQQLRREKSLTRYEPAQEEATPEATEEPSDASSDVAKTTPNNTGATSVSTPIQCQICFEVVLEDQRASKLCGTQCPALLCKKCLTRHVDLSLASCYSGIVPTLKCPICLIPIRMAAWAKHIEGDEASRIRYEYRRLCELACSFMPPCCHAPFYTQLPLHWDETTIDQDDGRYSQSPLSTDIAEMLPNLGRLRDQFCNGTGTTARNYVTYVVEAIDACDVEALCRGREASSVVNEVMYCTLADIEDPGQRATLLLTFLYLRPNVNTHCCDALVCFNCKREGHHDGYCADFDEVFDEDECLVQCRECRAMLLKVEGCEQVACACGFHMNWYDELNYRNLHMRGLVPVDIFDRSYFDQWNEWKAKLNLFTPHIPGKYSEIVVRGRVSRWLKAGNAVLVRSAFARFVWRRRLQRIVDEGIPQQLWRLRYQNIVRRGIAKCGNKLAI
uniref:RING-type domain-containing protein n=1 Tax=Globisporangium ultimum (strain ATCC 200006 / CBS 805.95 / DAOM BR144) TaxID=431595 RepID=K3W9A4_GLOUD